MIAASKICDWK